jgi:NAD(P)-dependent dehydrogenase (short-subunit alcohol dehydrogenase family)
MNSKNNEDEIRKCLATLEGLLSDGTPLNDAPEELKVALFAAAGRLSRPTKDEARARYRKVRANVRQSTQSADRQARSQTGIRVARQQTVYIAPPLSEGQDQELKQAQRCYVCKTDYSILHFFYDSMCPKCAEFNYQKRFQSARLDGQVALITGARLKIGYQAALMMLRAGARVLVTTRFPVDAAQRFARESEFAEWGSRLQIYGLDLRHTPSVELFTRYVEQHYERLDLLINNAAQTVRRPAGFYQHLLPTEELPWDQLAPDVQRLLSSHRNCKLALQGQGPEGNLPQPLGWHEQNFAAGICASARLSQIPYSMDMGLVPAEVFPEGQLDADLQQVDRRELNTWRLTLSQVATAEMLEVQLINSVAPFVLCSRLLPLMRRERTGQKHIVNVTAMEGKFTRYTKTDKHPHTNMAKAALNMLTHTSARGLLKDGIHMNAVDTGWVTDEDPAALSLRKQERHDFQPPLDIVDGAARVCDPFFAGLLTGEHAHGIFFKDYFPTEW